MALDPIVVRIVANTGLFDEAMRHAIEAIDRARPWLLRLRLDRQRDRSRLVTRRKQRNRW